ncbi:major facilitator superfamily transporter [Dactylonectria estremocensis]|uniref:Major facilitator superfamily transporter n=1 Tax=Dactylonectria estremocensis TaxID=1079267 RepID=A0A9P9FF18_9HYPO|nr:major facilitator superfamily transporter [Dactylonectria estremocensis]
MAVPDIQTDEELHERLPPGTVRLIDVDGGLASKDSKHAEGEGLADIILVPRPSEDPEDPLNWTFKRKVLATSCVIMYTIMVAIPSSAVYSIVTPIRKETSLTLTNINNGTGIMFLFYGWGCVIWQALALQYGKRPVYLFSIATNIIILATAPMCTTSGTYLANRILLGFFGAPVESLPEISVTDIWFAHERPTYLAWYGWSLALCGKLAPMLSGFINVGMGWKWTLWWCAIWNAIALIYCFLFMEETNYDRKHHLQPQEVAQPSPETSASPDNQKGEKTVASAQPDYESGEVQWPRKSFKDKLSLKDKKRPNRVVDIMIAPFKGFTYPGVVYAGLMYGANSLVWQGVQNATIGTIYSTEYGFSTAGIAAAYSGGVIGTVIGGLYCGKVGRMLTLRLARRNGGISEPEHALYVFVLSIFLVPFAMALYGCAVNYRLHWFALTITQVALAINAALCVGSALNYVICSYPELSGQLVTTCVLIRNTLSFAINYGITPWLNASGYLRVYCIVAGIGFVWNASVFVMARYGRWMRERTAERYWRDVDRARAKGLGH